jgi:hypothetical protein
MKFSSNIGLKIHNRFDIQVKDAETMEVIQTAQAENIVLDRIYTRLVNYQSYFDRIVFGSGTGILSPSRTTLFTWIGSKVATEESLVRSYPTSVWTKKITLGTEEFNGQTIREVGISNTTESINTHALITDSEGNPLEVEKTNLRIIDIYATVFVEVYSVDSGCFFYGDGLRNYLTGGSAPESTLQLSDGLSLEPERITKLTATKTTDAVNKQVQLAVRFNVQHFNKDVRAIDAPGLGLRWLMPRTGVYTGTVKTNVQLGTGDGSNKTFQLPNREVTSLTVMVDGVATSAYTRTVNDEIIFDTAPANDLLVTADYTTKYIPKDSDHVLDVIMKITFGASQPSPVMPAPDYSGLPGSNTLIGGDMVGGYFGEVSAIDLISGEDLCDAIGLTAGTLQESDAGWLKYYNNSEIIYVAKRTFRYAISWDAINAVGAIFGDKKIKVGNHVYAVRALSTEEWNKLIYPVHVSYGTWASFTDADIGVASDNGGATWTSTLLSSFRRLRGNSSVEDSSAFSPSSASSLYGFRPVLVYLYTLP